MSSPSRVIALVVLLAFGVGSAAAAADEGQRLQADQFPPPVLAPGKTEVKLPAPVTGTVIGGGGRFLILKMPKIRVVGVFDVSQAKVTKLISLPSDDFAVAAGAKKLYVGLRDLKQIQQYDLAKQTLDKNYAAPPCGVGSMAMGADAVAPLILLGNDKERDKGNGGQFLLLNPNTLQAVRYPTKHYDNVQPAHVHVSFDGSTAVVCGGSWAGIEVSDLIGGRVAGMQDGLYLPSGSTALLSGNGALVFVGHDEVYRADLTSKVSGIVGHAFPADDPAFSCSWISGDKAKGGGKKGKGKGKKSKEDAADKDEVSSGPGLAVFNNGDPRPLVVLHDLPEIAAESKLSLPDRVHLIPRARALVTVGEGNDRLILRQFDLAAALAAGGKDFLFVDSAPPAFAIRGTAYNYALHAESSKGGVVATLQSSPKGMVISKAGQIRWNVPSDYPQESASVIAQLTDASGQTVFHTFAIELGTPPKIPVAAQQRPDPVPNLPIVRPGIHLGFK